jgi:succinate dehydrogenase flavin-adding protein (antitoxin of CptAB toxin-antitoxin module)
MIDEEVPEGNPGLITYDDYWKDIEASQDLMSDPDIRKVNEVVSTIKDKIDTHFTGARESKKEVALKICRASAIKLLQDDLDKKNGTTVDSMIDDICYTSKLADDRELLMDIVDTTAQGIITATSGQYFEKNADNNEYFIRIEGGINFDQKIKDYAAQMSKVQKDEYFFAFLQEVLPLTHDTHVTGFKIWAHNIEWKSHKTFRDGYIFFGNPDQRSTTQPVQHFYMYFLPIFNGKDIKIKNDEDEIYFLMKDLSEDFREKVALYGAAKALEGTADTSQKRIYKQKISDHFKKALELFNNEYIQKTVVSYKGERNNLNGYHIPPTGSSKEQVFSEVASQVFEDWFTEENPNYPEFDSLLEPITKENFIRRVKQALIKVADPNQSNRDGEAVLSGLGLYSPNGLDYKNSMYAKSILKMLKDKGEGKVLNRNEILECKHQPSNLWITKDFEIEAELEFVVLAALSALGEIEINMGSGLTINSTNLDELKNLSPDEYFSFTHIKPPKGLNLAVVKAVFKGLGLPDLSNQLHDENTFYKMREAADKISKQAVKLKAEIADGIKCRSVEILSESEAREKGEDLQKLSSFCDTLRNYTTEAKLKNFRYSKDEVEDVLSKRSLIEELQQQVDLANQFEQIITYMSQCKQYVPDGDLKQDIQAAINRLADELSGGDDSRIENYKSELEDLRGRYADYYMEQYAKHTISQSDDTKKQVLLQSEDKQICDILKDADFLSTNVYTEWLNNIRKLRPAQDDIVNREAVLTTPYLDDFNPLDYKGEETYSIKELKVELENILVEWTESLRESLDDPAVKGNMDALADEISNTLKEFKKGAISLTTKNALQIRNALSDLHEGLDKIELTSDSLKSTFKKPLTPDEAVDAFKEYVNQITHGKERDKVRIILK